MITPNEYTAKIPRILDVPEDVFVDILDFMKQLNMSADTFTVIESGLNVHVVQKIHQPPDAIIDFNLLFVVLPTSFKNPKYQKDLNDRIRQNKFNIVNIDTTSPHGVKMTINDWSPDHATKTDSPFRHIEKKRWHKLIRTLNEANGKDNHLNISIQKTYRDMDVAIIAFPYFSKGERLQTISFSSILATVTVQKLQEYFSNHQFFEATFSEKNNFYTVTLKRNDFSRTPTGQLMKYTPALSSSSSSPSSSTSTSASSSSSSSSSSSYLSSSSSSLLSSPSSSLSYVSSPSPLSSTSSQHYPSSRIVSGTTTHLNSSRTIPKHIPKTNTTTTAASSIFTNITDVDLNNLFVVIAKKDLQIIDVTLISNPPGSQFGNTMTMDEFRQFYTQTLPTKVALDLVNFTLSRPTRIKNFDTHRFFLLPEPRETNKLTFVLKIP